MNDQDRQEPTPLQQEARQVSNPARTRLWRRTGARVAVVTVMVLASVRLAGPSAAAPPSLPSIGASPNASNDAEPTTARSQAAAAAALDDSHGEYSVGDGDGRVRRTWQSGQLTALTASSMTVVSPDGYSADYLVGPTAKAAGFTVGENVTVLATID